MTLYMLMAALLVVAALLATRPWWQRSPVRAVQRRAANVAAYRLRIAEIEADRAAGLIDAAAAQELKDELDARVLADAQAPDGAPAAAPQRRSAMTFVVACALVMFSGALYYQGGSWRTGALVDLARNDPQRAQQLAIEQMVARLAAKLQDQPDDLQGWAMLGRSQFVLQRYAESAQSYGRAAALAGEPGDPGLLASQAEALAMANGHDLQGEPLRLLEAALKIDPGHVKSLWFAGIAALQRGDSEAAKSLWTRLAQQDLPDDLRAALDEQLEHLGVTPPPRAPAAAGLALQVQVDLAPALHSKFSDAQTLFVFAKAESGPPMPLAVQRMVSPKLPLAVTLDDSMAMMPQLKLSQFDHWIVTARLTRGGTVQAESGDLQGQVTLTKAQAGQPIHIVIDQVVP